MYMVYVLQRCTPTQIGVRQGRQSKTSVGQPRTIPVIPDVRQSAFFILSSLAKQLHYPLSE